MDPISHYGVLHLCIIQNQEKESTFLSRHTFYMINLVHKYIASLNEVK